MSIDISYPNLPVGYTVDENTYFHPPVIAALEEALRRLDLSGKYVLKMQLVDKALGRPDITIVDSVNGRPVVPIEIKKTLPDLQGKGRRQAKDYRDNLPDRITDFYVATNLEVIETFLWSPTRSATQSQLLQTDCGEVGTLGEVDEKEFYERLVLGFSEVIELVEKRKIPVYRDTLYLLETRLRQAYDDLDDWKRVMRPAVFEAIRVRSNVAGLFEETSKWNDAEYYLDEPELMNRLASRIDFNVMFGSGARIGGKYISSPEILQSVAKEVVRENRNETLSSLVMELVRARTPHNGVVETDRDLSRVLSRAILEFSDSSTRIRGRILDPAAGNGRLLLDFKEEIDYSISPGQILAVEVEPRFTEILSLNLGLAYSNELSPSDHPRVISSEFQTVDSSDLEDVSVVIMNPPFLPYSQSSGEVQGKIREIQNRTIYMDGHHSVLDRRQPSFESVFLEHLVSRVQPGTMVGTVMQVRLLNTLGSIGESFRKFLVEKFGLRAVIMYRPHGLFDQHKVETVLLIGSVGRPEQTVALLTDYKRISSRTPRSPLSETFRIRHLSTSLLSESVDKGWKMFLTPAGQEALPVIQMMHGMEVLSSIDVSRLKRGGFGNQGGNKILVWSSTNHGTVSRSTHGLKSIRLCNARFTPRGFRTGDVWHGQWTVQTSSSLADRESFEKFALGRTPRTETMPSAQGKSTKEIDELFRISNQTMSKYSIDYDAVIIPRASRAEGHVGLHLGQGPKIAYSSNYFLWACASEEEAVWRASFLSSVFGQLQLEMFGNSESGMRKVEKSAISKVFVPDYSSVDTSFITEISDSWWSEKPLNLKDLQARKSDRLWAQRLSNDSRGEQLLQVAMDALENLVAVRPA